MAAAEQDSEYLQAKATLQDGTPVEAWGHLGAWPLPVLPGLLCRFIALHPAENFYKKYNKVLLDKLAIKQEKLRLQKVSSVCRLTQSIQLCVCSHRRMAICARFSSSTWTALRSHVRPRALSCDSWWC